MAGVPHICKTYFQSFAQPTAKGGITILKSDKLHVKEYFLSPFYVFDLVTDHIIQSIPKLIS